VPHYRIHVHREREEFPDEVGYDLPDLAAARSRACALIRQLTGPSGLYDWSNGWAIILDENGEELDRISISESVRHAFDA
jgi:hypothetical protein